MIKCLYGGCLKTFVDEEVKLYISPELFRKYRKFKATQLKLSNPERNFINCPTPNCEELIDANTVEFGENKIECEKGHKFCCKCMNPGWHSQGSKCRNVKINYLLLVWGSIAE
jgi:hypothetical protein